MKRTTTTLGFSPSFNRNIISGSGSRRSNVVLASSSSHNNDCVSVAIIGGGIAGLSCARHLQLHSDGKLQPTVFDTGRLRPGGRCSSRLPNDKPANKKRNQDSILSNLIIDHTAQILTSPSTKNEHWSRQIQEWELHGNVRAYPPNSVVQIKKTQKEDSTDYCIESCDTTQMYYGTNGMASIPLALMTPPTTATPTDPTNNNNNSNNRVLFPMYQDVWISPSNGVKYGKEDGKWLVQTNGRKFGKFDALVIAHNGKCADRLMSRTPAKALHSLLVTDFRPKVPAWGGNRMTLNSIYSLTFAIPSQKSACFDEINQALHSTTATAKNDNVVICAFLQNHPNLRMIVNQTNKYKLNQTKSSNKKYVVYTLLSSANFGKKYKGPQENLPIETVEKVSQLLYKSLEESLNLSGGLLSSSVVDSRLQLWGAAVPINTYDDNNTNGFVYDSKYNAGACGDWLLDSSIYGAWESGRRLAHHMIENNNKKSSIGLPKFNSETKRFKSKFRVNNHSGIGNIQS